MALSEPFNPLLYAFHIPPLTVLTFMQVLSSLQSANHEFTFMSPFVPIPAKQEHSSLCFGVQHFLIPPGISKYIFFCFSLFFVSSYCNSCLWRRGSMKTYQLQQLKRTSVFATEHWILTISNEQDFANYFHQREGGFFLVPLSKSRPPALFSHLSGRGLSLNHLRNFLESTWGSSRGWEF